MFSEFALLLLYHVVLSSWWWVVPTVNFDSTQLQLWLFCCCCYVSVGDVDLPLHRVQIFEASIVGLLLLLLLLLLLSFLLVFFFRFYYQQKQQQHWQYQPNNGNDSINKRKKYTQKKFHFLKVTSCCLICLLQKVPLMPQSIIIFNISWYMLLDVICSGASM